MDVTISDLVERGQPVTLDALGGISALSSEEVASPLFPYVAEAVVAAWHGLSAEEHNDAADLLCAAIIKATSAVALNDTCLTVVPVATDLGIALAVKDALRDKAAIRTDQTTGGLAAMSIRWLAHLAVVAAEARPALADVLTGVARQEPEPMPFAGAAAQVAGLSYDCWRDINALGCLDRLTNSDAEADAWFGLGQARLVDAFEALDREGIFTGLRDALACFDYAMSSAEDRADAALYGHIIRFVTEWASNATTEMLESHLAGAEAALHDYMLGGRGLPQQPMWLRPRYEAENAWIIAVRQLRTALGTGREGTPWYEPAVAIGALADAYRAASSLRPRRATADATATAFPNLIAPQLTAPILDNAERLAYVEIWLHHSDDPNADAFARMVRDAANAQVVPPKRAAAGRHPAVEQLLGADPADLPDTNVVDLIELRLQDRSALGRMTLRPVISQIIDSTIEQLAECPDFKGRVREELEPIVVQTIRFLARCLDAQRGGEGTRMSYLFKADAEEKDLQQDLIDWFISSGLYGLDIEAQQIGGGRIDLMFAFDGFRFVLELKREQADTTEQTLKKYLRQAGSYQVTNIAVGMLVVLDLGTESLAPHMRDNVWVDRLPSKETDGTDRFVAVVRIPGNRLAPSRL